MYLVYILKSQTFQKTYTGITNDINRRLHQHNSGFHPYTKRYKPWKVLYTEQFPNRILAHKRELYFKSSAGRKWLSKTLFGKIG